LKEHARTRPKGANAEIRHGCGQGLAVTTPTAYIKFCGILRWLSLAGRVGD
jgi:hypothetical protein